MINIHYIKLASEFEVNIHVHVVICSVHSLDDDKHKYYVTFKSNVTYLILQALVILENQTAKENDTFLIKRKLNYAKLKDMSFGDPIYYWKFK